MLLVASIFILLLVNVFSKGFGRRRIAGHPKLKLDKSIQVIPQIQSKPATMVILPDGKFALIAFHNEVGEVPMIAEVDLEKLKIGPVVGIGASSDNTIIEGGMKILGELMLLTMEDEDRMMQEVFSVTSDTGIVSLESRFFLTQQKRHHQLFDVGKNAVIEYDYHVIGKSSPSGIVIYDTIKRKYVGMYNKTFSTNKPFFAYNTECDCVFVAMGNGYDLILVDFADLNNIHQETVIKTKKNILRLFSSGNHVFVLTSDRILSAYEVDPSSQTDMVTYRGRVELDSCTDIWKCHISLHSSVNENLYVMELDMDDFSKNVIHRIAANNFNVVTKIDGSLLDTTKIFSVGVDYAHRVVVSHKGGEERENEELWVSVFRVGRANLGIWVIGGLLMVCLLCVVFCCGLLCFCVVAVVLVRFWKERRQYAWAQLQVEDEMEDGDGKYDMMEDEQEREHFEGEGENYEQNNDEVYDDADENYQNENDENQNYVENQHDHEHENYENENYVENENENYEQENYEDHAENYEDVEVE